MSVALAGFRTYRFEVTNAGVQDAVGSIYFAYCKASGEVCPGVDNYLSVAEGRILHWNAEECVRVGSN